MKINSILVLLFIFASVGCKETKTAVSTPEPPPEAVKETKPILIPAPNSTIGTAAAEDILIEPDADATKQNAVDPIMAFIVSFYSIGEGIDRGMPDKLKAFTGDFNKKNSLNIEYTETHWGREGETDYCFPLKGLSDSQVSAFISGSKDAIKGAEHVHYLENQACRKGR